MKIKIFGVLKDIIEDSEIAFSTESTIQDLKSTLESSYPDLRKYQYKIAVNQQLVSDTTPIKEGDEIALLPPFAGG
jgi:sulfur-carrier protein